MKMIEKRQDFPESYYQETDPGRRQTLLLEALEREDTEENRIRKRLWELRYKKFPRSREQQWTDGYIKLWMSLKFAAQYVNSFFGGRGAKKDVYKLLDELEIRQLMEEGQETKDLLYREFYHGACVYLRICSSDRNYSSTILGMVPMKEGSVQEKIARDIYESLYVGVRFAQVEAELDLFRQAAKEAFEDMIPAQSAYLQRMIDQG
ncbi:MAG: hypothetical protein HFH56_04080 [Lachnospiraceae bacterium]|jgi:hypothetical protein|nr:hypothetical protein [Lachnospiraceae bacterium]